MDTVFFAEQIVVGNRPAAGVPPAVPFRSKPELDLELIRPALAAGGSPAPVLGAGVYGDSAEFGEGLRQLGMEFFLQVSARHKAYPVATARKRIRHYPGKGTPAAQTLAELAAAWPAGKGKACAWRAAAGRARHTRLACCSVYRPHPLRDGNAPLERAWLVLDWPADQPEP